MRKLFALIVATILVCTSATAEEDSPAIAVIDIPKILDQTKSGKEATRVVKEFRENMAKEVDRAKKQYLALRDELQKQEALLSAEARAEKISNLRSREEEIRQRLEKQEDQLKKIQVGEVEKVLAKIDVILDQLAVERGFTYVLDGDPRVVLYRNSKVDITDRVISELGK